MNSQNTHNENIIKENIYGFEFNLDFEKDGGAVLNKTLFADKLTNKKAYKEFKKLTSTINFKDHKFQADPVSINFMSAVVNLANLQFNQAIAKGTKPADAFEAVYGRAIAWKDVNNQWVEMTVGEISQGLELALENLKKILEKYN